MKLIVRIACIVLCTGLLVEAAEQGQTANPATAALTQLEQDWATAMIKADIPKLQSICADSLVYVLAAGGIERKTAFLANVKKGAVKYLSIDRSDLQVVVTGDTAVVASQALFKLQTPTGSYSGRTRMLHTYVKLDGRWQLMAHQMSVLQ